MDAKLTAVLDKMADRGLNVDPKALEAYLQENIQKRDKLGQEIYTESGISNPGSRKEVDQRTNCGMKQDKVTLSKQNSPLLTKVSQWRVFQREVSYAESFKESVQKFEDNHLDRMGALISQEAAHRVYWSWKEAESGRLYTHDYNVQQISKGARKTIVPDNGLFVCMDYRQSEIRVAAILSQDEQLKADIASGDVYATLANIYFQGIKDSREAVKVMVLGILYGMEPEGISKRLDIPVEAAQKILDSMYKRYAKLAEWIKDTHVKASQTGKVTTMDGFTRVLTEPDHDKRMRQSINTTVQGSMADVIKRAAIAFNEKYEKPKVAELACLVHDSLVIDMMRGDTADDSLAQDIKRGLEFEIQGVKMELKVKQGDTWGDVTDDKPELVETRI